MKKKISRGWSALLVLSLLCPAWAGDGVDPDSTETAKARRQLEAYFARIHETAPTTFGLSMTESDASTLAVVAADAFRDEELARFGQAMDGEPGWEMAPEALAGSLPAEFRAQVEAIGRDRVHALERAEALRRQVVLSARALLLVGDERLAERGISANDIRTTLSAFETLGPIEVIVSRTKLEQAAQQLAEIQDEISPALRDLASSLPASTDGRDAEAIRRRIDSTLRKVGDLPAFAQKGTRPETILRARKTLSELSPQAVLAFEGRRGFADLERTVEALSDASALTPEAAERAENLKGELAGFLEAPAITALLPEESAALRARLDQAHPLEIPLIRDLLSRVDGWENIPALLELAASEEVQAEVADIRMGSLSAERMAALDLFRSEMMARNSGTGSIEQAVRSAWEDAPYEDLVFWSRAAGATGSAQVSATVTDLVIGGERTGILPLPGKGKRGCGLNISCYVGRVKDALRDAFADAIYPVSNLANTVADKIVDIGTTVSTFVASLPENLWNLMSRTWQSLAAAIENEFGPEGIVEKLGLVEGFWDDVPDLPEIPCPPLGTDIPFFGKVGDADAALKYNSYLWIFDQLLEMLPDTSVSLKVKLPAHVLHSGVQFMGICMQNAADAVAEGETEAYEAFVASGTTESLNRLADLDQDTSSLRRSLGEFSVAMEESLAATRRLVTANAIEANLLASQNDRIASFMLPRSVGGYIEVVRDIVAETIDNSEKAQGDVDRARRLLLSADDLYATGEYRLAYDAYRLAYRSALGALPGDVRMVANP